MNQEPISPNSSTAPEGWPNRNSDEIAAKVFNLYLTERTLIPVSTTKADVFRDLMAPDRPETLIGTRLGYAALYMEARRPQVREVAAAYVRLHLKSLAHLADEDIVEVARICGWDEQGAQADPVSYGMVIRDYLRKQSFSYQPYLYLVTRRYAVPLFFGPGHWANGKNAVELGCAVWANEELAEYKKEGGNGN